MARKLNEEALWTFALKSLGQRAQTIGELRTKLRQRADESVDVEATLSKLKEYGVLDDRRFAETFATSRVENQGFGKDRVLRDLKQRRVAPALAEKTIATVFQGRNEIALIEDYIRRKYRSAPREGLFQEDKELASAFRRLRMAGFTSGNIIRVLKQFARDPDLLDGLTETEDEPNS